MRSDSYACLFERTSDHWSHLSGYRNSAPVRIGNGAAFHQQFDIYGELMDAIYLYNKYGKPITWDQWVSVREILDYVLTIWRGKLELFLLLWLSLTAVSARQQR